ncbi:hypothetical protein BDR04DRAFT_1159547 [Suillus decipiens]|nr:hypothetical protein BDR04DRAFT_1159547 [Suillus decipiens]
MKEYQKSRRHRSGPNNSPGYFFNGQQLQQPTTCFNTFFAYLRPLKVSNSVANDITNVQSSISLLYVTNFHMQIHPCMKAALKIFTYAPKVYKVSVTGWADDSRSKSIPSSWKRKNPGFDPCQCCVKIAQQTLECADFTSHCSETKSAPSKAIASPVLIAIEVLHESSETNSREQILRLLAGKLNASTSHPVELQADFGILLASRSLKDINDTLHATPHVRHGFLVDISSISAELDIQRYISHKLEDMCHISMMRTLRHSP